MNATNFFTRKVLGMDYGIWVTMIFVCFLSLGLYSYQEMKGLDSDCALDTIYVNGKKAEVVVACYLNRLSSFEIPSETAHTVSWEFSDDRKHENGRFVSHKFTEEGTYEVKVIINGKCELDIDVEVVYDPFSSEDQSKPKIGIYPEPFRPAVGSTVTLSCITDMPVVTSYLWRNLTTNETRNEPSPEFVFKQEGEYEFELILNNNQSYRTSLVLTVTPGKPALPSPGENNNPPTGAPGDFGSLGRLVPLGSNPSDTHKDLPPIAGAGNKDPGAGKPDSANKVSGPKVPEIDDEGFKDLLQNVVNEEGKELEDLYQYLDYTSATMVEMNQNGSLIPLKEFCKIMRNKKKNKRKIESVTFKRDNKKSIQTLKVTLAKSGGFWDKLNPFN